MNINTNTLRFRLYTWYFGSLIILSVYFYIIVHLLMLPHSTHIFLLLLTLMTLLGFAVIYKITSSINSLAAQISTITSSNLNKRVQYTDGSEEIRTLAHSFNRVLNNLDNAFKREQQFIGDLAHELKTPLATLHTSFEVALSKDRTAEEYRKILYESLKDTAHLSSTLQNVLDLAWTETKHEQKTMEQINLSELVEEIAEIASRMAANKNITVSTNIQKAITITGRKEKLAHALINIIENAVNYTEKGVVMLSLEKKHTNAIIIIQDTGLGIAKADIPHIFDRFYRGKKTDSIRGSGLGLAIAHSIIELHNGTIEVQSETGKGSTFTISIPSSCSFIKS